MIHVGICAVLANPQVIGGGTTTDVTKTRDTRCYGEGATGQLGNGTNMLNWIPRPISEPW